MNYTELVAAIKEYTQNSETTFVSQIPTFVRQAEERIMRRLRLPELRKNATGSTTAANAYLARPSDFLAMFSIAIVDGSGDYTYLYDKDVNFIREAYPNPATTGVPRYYAQFDGDIVSPSSDGNFLLGPTPDDNYTVEIHYYYDPPSIVTGGTSWLGDNAETALLYGALLEAYTFMKGEQDVMSVYMAQYADAMKALGVLDVMSKRDEYKDGATRSAA